MDHMTSPSRAAPSGFEDIPPFDVSLRSDDASAWVVEVRGELDIATGPTLRERLGSYPAPNSTRGYPPRIVYLLSKLEFMDCRGFHYLLTAVRGNGPETITIREPSKAVRRFLELAGMDSMIEAD